MRFVSKTRGQKTAKFTQGTAATHVWVDNMYNFFEYLELIMKRGL